MTEGKDFRKDFVTDKVADLEVSGYEKGAWKFQPTTAGEENDWLDQTMISDESGKPKQDYKKLNQLKLNRIVKVPYNQELIKEMIGIDQTWEKLSINQKWALFSKMRPALFDSILRAINLYETGTDTSKKD